jgi:phospholipase C
MNLSWIPFTLRKTLKRARRSNQKPNRQHRPQLGVELLEDRSLLSASSPLNQIDHFVVIYQENWSFDALYGSFPGANGLQNATNAQGNLLVPQVDKNGKPISTITFNPGQINDPNIPDNATTLAPKPYDLSQFVPPSSKTSDIVHRFYTEQMQIGNGALQPGADNNSKFITWSDNPQAVMSTFNATNMPEGLLAQQYTMDDNLFHAAYGGSYLNHQFLVAAAAPQWQQPIPNGFQSTFDPNTQALKDGNLTIDGKYVVNTTFSTNLVPNFVTPGAATLENSINDSNPSDPNRVYEQNIGDLLNGADVSWKWYSGGWNAAVNLQKAYQSGDANAIAAAKAPFNDPNNPLNLFQWHHQPLAYFDNFSPLSAGGQAHLQDETNFYTDLANGNLPSVSFIKPLGPDNEHPGYTSLLQGQQHVAELVHMIQNSPEWAHTAIIITYDENGGRFDHVIPPQRDAFGDGTRVPGIVISPYAKQGFVDHTQYDTLSILKTIETRFGLSSLNARDGGANSLVNSFQSTAHPDIARVYVQPSFDTPGTFTLIVGGTEGNDTINITKTGSAVHVVLDGHGAHIDQQFNQTISRIEVYGQGGNDHITVDPAVTIPAFLFGGDGNDTIHAGGGNSVVVGGDGKDSLFGGSAPSILIGGDGKDDLEAGTGAALIIAGSTAHDLNFPALQALESEWSRNDGTTYQQKIDHLMGNTTGGNNLSFFLNSSTVFQDGGKNSLTGGSAQDWFFAHLASNPKDMLSGMTMDETVTEI